MARKGKGLGLLVAFGIGVGAGYLFFGQQAAPAPAAVGTVAANNNSTMPMSTIPGYGGYSQAVWLPSFATASPIGNPRSVAGLSERTFPNLNKMRMIPVQGKDYEVFDPNNVIWVD